MHLVMVGRGPARPLLQLAAHRSAASCRVSLVADVGDPALWLAATDVVVQTQYGVDPLPE